MTEHQATAVEQGPRGELTQGRRVISLSLGAGIQSVTLALLLEHGLLAGYEPPDLAVFADTQAEPPHVYQTLDWLESRVSFPIVRATLGDLRADTWRGIRGEGVPNVSRKPGSYVLDIPVFSIGGPSVRQCTTNYKINVIKRAIRQWTGLTPPALSVLQYVGISRDEAQRMKPARERYITVTWPLALSGWTRTDCREFLKREYPDCPVGRSSCFFCPYHSMAEWAEIRSRYPELYDEAIAMEDALQQTPDGPWFLRQGGLRKSMAQLDLQGRLELDTEPDHFGNECEGLCGV